jgi:gamma-glutamyl phosphate reductase
MIVDIRSCVIKIAENAKRAAGKLARLSTDVKNRALLHMADELIRQTDALK